MNSTGAAANDGSPEKMRRYQFTSRRKLSLAFRSSTAAYMHPRLDANAYRLEKKEAAILLFDATGMVTGNYFTEMAATECHSSAENK